MNRGASGKGIFFQSGRLGWAGVLALAAAFIMRTAALAAEQPSPPEDPAVPAPKRTRSGDFDENWRRTHEGFARQAKEGKIRLLLIGDSITAGWRNHPQLWDKYFGAYDAANFGIGGDRTQHVLWRLENGEVDGSRPEVVILLIGTNNIGTPPHQVARGIRAIVDLLRAKLPESRLLLLGIFPRGGGYHDGGRRFARETNTLIRKLADEDKIHYLDLTSHFVQPDGTLPQTMFPDKLHLAEEGYAVWGEAIAPQLREWMAP